MAAISPRELARRIEADPRLVVVDLRDAALFARGAIERARNLAFDVVVSTLKRELDWRRPIVFVCEWGHRSAIACISLKREGFRDVRWLEGGMESWGLAALPVVRGSAPPRPPDRRAAAAGE